MVTVVKFRIRLSHPALNFILHVSIVGYNRAIICEKGNGLKPFLSISTVESTAE